MDIFVNVVIFLVAAAIVWYFAGVLVDAVGRVANRYCKTGFFVSFFILGFLTSISEISVATNAILAGVPGVSVGNLAGASFVILLFIVPLLAAAGKGVEFNTAVSERNLILILAVVVLPLLLVIDGDVTRSEGLLALLAYGTVVYSLYRNRAHIDACDIAQQKAAGGHKSLMKDLARILVGAVAIFGAAYFLVEQAVFFASVLSVPASLVGLILLSIGTNIPEIVIAIRCILRRRVDIALGDYLGSAVMNTFIFGGLALASGTFFLEASEFVISTILLILGLVCFYAFAHSKSSISRREGLILLLFYAAFLVLQFANLVRFATN